ncbi:hypothetical protein SODALDRAFT_376643 [Sodiomyces alkalinus F11]|uniref:Uncharacterized protein n=1 Tax=Sodiomyces alkalinus (strain CBS 110278 / VKM F-3762 / F11) TaxID=1314773 RepID=A0A3N2Q2K4_SODAK|nr:hypothetical protein SODALDRAFT_376643 [Sodiomyces alkalinus F11]ROT40908.1 hypothetical protein SODALDRAFT_376643 [Sodiomyces alkalinus F11]
MPRNDVKWQQLPSAVLILDSDVKNYLGNAKATLLAPSFFGELGTYSFETQFQPFQPPTGCNSYNNRVDHREVVATKDAPQPTNPEISHVGRREPISHAFPFSGSTYSMLQSLNVRAGKFTRVLLRTGLHYTEHIRNIMVMPSHFTTDTQLAQYDRVLDDRRRDTKKGISLNAVRIWNTFEQTNGERRLSKRDPINVDEARMEIKSTSSGGCHTCMLQVPAQRKGDKGSIHEYGPAETLYSVAPPINENHLILDQD